MSEQQGHTPFGRGAGRGTRGGIRGGGRGNDRGSGRGSGRGRGIARSDGAGRGRGMGRGDSGSRGRGISRGISRGGAGCASTGPKKESFARVEALGTFKAIQESNRHKVRQAEEQEYLGSPPPDQKFIQVNLVLPGQHLLPQGLDEPNALDAIRRDYRVYITNPKPNILDIRCDNMTRMRKALDAINWTIRDMRLSNDNPAVRFLVQSPTNADSSEAIRAKLLSRPRFVKCRPNLIDAGFAMDEHLEQLTRDMSSTAESLMALNKTMRMRVQFGHLIIEKRKKGTEDEITYNDLVKVLKLHSTRGGARLEARQVPTATYPSLSLIRARFPDTHQAETLLRFLIKPEQGICGGPGAVKVSHEVIVDVDGLEIKTEAEVLRGRKPQLSMARAAKPETWGRMNWTIAAPDMEHDWSYRVDAWDNTETPKELRDLAQKITMKPDTEADQSHILTMPLFNLTRLIPLESKINKVKLKTLATIPYKDTPYVIQIGITKSSSSLRAPTGPEITWGVEFYAPHWDESINVVRGGDRRKDWGKGLENIWQDDGPDVNSRLKGFLQTVLEVQALLNSALPSAS